MLLYFNRTQHNFFSIERFLDCSGNIVLSTIDGSICIEKDAFWNIDLVRNDPSLRLNKFNQVTYGWVKSGWVECNGFTVSAGADFGVGPWSELGNASNLTCGRLKRL